MTSSLTIETPGDRELVMTRVFDAPRRLVWDAMTRPELIRRWYGERGWTMEVCEVDLRVGGAWRYVTSRPDGKRIGQHGTYREVVAPERLVQTEAWDDWNLGEVLVTSTMVEHDGQTTFTSTLLFPTPEVRTMLIKAGMTRGVAETYDKLAEVLAQLG